MLRKILWKLSWWFTAPIISMCDIDEDGYIFYEDKKIGRIKGHRGYIKSIPYIRLRKVWRKGESYE